MAAKEKKTPDINGTGRRKSSVARVRVVPGSGKFLINKRDIEAYFPKPSESARVLAPLNAVGCASEVDVLVRVSGGGFTGQSGATALGLARALVKFNSEYEEPLRKTKLLTVDARRKERKKYGRAGARRSFQFSKR